ncbi:MAG: dUTP diphosphatase [Candidatus Nanoarchaeia archaeon]|jgi:dUTP pyrophosphatase|nr:dUTP diphosphatase [Candidatus Nanoarchaeia archaeon]
MFKNFYLNIQLLSENAKMPTRGTKESAGLDFYTPINIIIEPRKDVLIPLDICVEMPQGYTLIMKEKSGIATKKKCDILACVIDSDYRGNVHAHLYNNSDHEVTFTKGDKICQGLVFPVWNGVPKLVNEVDVNTERKDGGFGSTGDK